MSGMIPYAGYNTHEGRQLARRMAEDRSRPGSAGRPRKWTPERLAAAKTMMKAGLTAAECGLELGCSRNAVLGALFRERHENADDQADRS